MKKNALTSLVAALVAVPLFSAANAQQLNVYNWSDYIEESLIAQFEEETGIKVTYDVFDSNELLETKLLSGSTGYDIVVPSAAFLSRQIQAGVFQKLDYSKIPNSKYLWEEVKERVAEYDPGNEYSVNYMWGTTGIGYNVQKVKERLGYEPDSWEALFNPESAAKLADCGIYVLDAPTEVFPSVLAYLGKDGRSNEQADFEAAFDQLMKVRPYIKKFHSSEYINALANGDICIALGWSGDVLIARDRAAEAAENTGGEAMEIQYVIPKEGAIMWFDQLAITKDAANLEEAFAFIDFLNRPDIAGKNVNYVNYASGNKGGQEFTDPEILADSAIYPNDEVMKNLFTTKVSDLATDRRRNRLWTRFVTGQ